MCKICFCLVLLVSCLLSRPTAVDVRAETALPETAANDLPDLNDQSPLALQLMATDFPNSPFLDFAAKVFPKLTRGTVAWGQTVNYRDRSCLLMMAENQALPILEAQNQYGFVSFYRASLVIVSDLKRVENPIQSFAELNRQSLGTATRLGLFTDPDWLMAAVASSVNDDAGYEQFLHNLAELSQVGQLAIYSGSFANRPYPLLAFSPQALGAERQAALDDLPPVMIMPDYLAAQLNRSLAEVRYVMKVPSEGSLYIDYGLFASSRETAWLLAEQTSAAYSERNQALLLSLGYRLPNGALPREERIDDEGIRSVSSWGYPPEADYERVKRIRNYLEYNAQVLQRQSEFQRRVLGAAGFHPVSPEQFLSQFLLMSLLSVLALAAIYYRIDERSVRWHALAFALSFGLWMVSRLISVLMQSQERQSILFYLSLLPMLLMISVFYLACTEIAYRHQVIQLRERRAAIGVILPNVAFALLLLSNEQHSLLFEVQRRSYGTDLILHLEAVFYLMCIFELFVLLSALALLARVLGLKWREPPLLACLAFLLLAVAYNLSYFLSAPLFYRFDYHLVNAILVVAFLELLIRLRLIPANSGYYQLFRHSPNHMRLLDRDLSEMYLPMGLAPLSDSAFASIKRELRSFYKRQNSEQERHGWQDWLGEAWRKPQRQRNKNSLKVADPNSPNLSYGIKALSGPYLIWDEDLRTLNLLGERLAAMRNQLAQQNHLLERQQSVQSELVAVQVRQSLLQEVEASLSEQMAEIRAILEKLKERDLQQEHEAVRSDLARVKIMVSQCKRKSNLLVREETSLAVEELKLILNEALNDAAGDHLSALVRVQGQEKPPIEDVLILYDYLQFLLKKTVDCREVELFLTVRSEASGLIFRILYTSQEELERPFFEPGNKLQQRFAERGLEAKLSQEGRDWQIELNLRRQPC